MSTQPKPDSYLDDLRELLVDFGIPVFLLIILTVLLLTGMNSEVKTLFAATVGWLIKSGVSRVKQ